MTSTRASLKLSTSCLQILSASVALVGRCRGAGLAGAALGLSFAVHAQTPPAISAEQQRQIDQLNRLQQQRIPNPLPRASTLDLRILAPEKSAVPKAVDELEFIVSGVDLEGASYFSKHEIDALFAPLLNRKVGVTALREAANRLEQKYRDLGFFLVRVFLPPQQVTDGIFKIRVIEGRVSQVYVEGPDTAMNERVATFARHLSDIRPLDLAGLERVLLIINDLPGVSAAGVLRPGAELGTSDLLLTVSPVRSSQLVTANNNGSQSTGPYSLSYIVTMQQPLKSPGQLNLSFTRSGTSSNHFEGVRNLAPRYSQELGSRGLMFSLGGTLSESRPGGSLSSLGIQSNSAALAPRLRYALQRSRASSVYLEGGLALNSSKTTMAESVLTQDRSSVLDLAGSWVLNGWMDGTQSISLGMSHGIAALGAMDSQALRPSTSDFKPRFLKFVLSLQRTQALPGQFSLAFSASGQYSGDRLLAGERLAFGGSAIGRGFPAGTISGDRGLGASLELTRPFKLGLDPAVSNFQVFVSTDSASTRTNESTNIPATSAHLSSQALGVRFNVLTDTLVDLRIARANQALVSDDPGRRKRLLIEVTKPF